MVGAEEAPLGAHAQVIAGQSPDGQFYNQDGNGLPFYQGKKDFGDWELQPPTKWTTRVTKEALPGDILMSVRAPVGPVNFTREKVCIGRGLAAIRCRNGLDADYLFYQLLGMQGRIAGKEGAVFASISKAEIEALPIVAPHLSEQRRIVAILDEAFEAIAIAKANAEKNLQNARAIFENHLQSVLLSTQWEWRTLGELCDDVEYGSSAKSKKEGSIPVLRMGNIQEGKLDWENLVYTDDKAEIKKYLLKKNDVLFNRTNSPELVGKTAIYRGEMPAIFAGYLIRIHRKEGLLDADFLTYFLNSQIAFDYGKTVVTSSVNQANINGTKLKGYPIPAPSLSEQQAIVAKLNRLAEETQRLARIYEQKQAALDALKKSLLHQAFSGTL
mgnify:CR=1 FL=1